MSPRRLESLPFTMGLAMLACSASAGGPQYTEVELRVSDAQGMLGDAVCVPLPVLPGGASEQTAEFEGRLSCHVVATRDDARVTFGGIVDARDAARRISHDALFRGYDERIETETLAGTPVSIDLSSPCADTP